MFHHLGKAYNDPAAAEAAAGNIFLWAPVAWALAGYFLTGWRWKFKTGEQGRDCLILASVLSVIMGIGCIFMPRTPPGAGAEQVAQQPILKTLEMLGDGNFLLFVIVSMIVAGLMQFYFQGTAQFMQDVGIQSRNVPASMGIAQAIQALATFLALGVMLNYLGFKWTLVAGALSWVILYVLYVVGRSWRLIVPAQAFHGLAYVFFIIGGQIYANSVGSKDILSTMQALIFAATMGVGMVVGTRFAGVVMDRYKEQGRFLWRSVFIVPCIILAVCTLALGLFFRA